MLPKKRNKKILLISFILITIIIAEFYIKVKQQSQSLISEKKIFSMIEKASSLKEDTYGATTYYVSSDGVSQDGTDINNPMSLETANKKVFYGNDKVLFKKGDTFYGTINFNVNANEEKMLYIGSYGDESLEKPIITTSTYVTEQNAWKIEEANIYRLDLSDRNYIQGYYGDSWNIYNVGFFKDENNNIYGNKKSTKDELTNNYDFYCKDNYLFIKAEDNPNTLLGKITIANGIPIVQMSSNTIIDGIIIQDTGVHEMQKKDYPIKNVYITNCVVQNIGGSYQSGTTRYGNGIEFWNQAENTLAQGCLFKNIYDAAYTLQGSNATDGFYSNICENNIFINCTYPIEVFCHNEYDISKCKFEGNTIENNIIVNQGKGFGYTSRPDQYQPANLITWIIPENSGQKNTFEENKCYNCRALYYKDSGTEKDTLKKSFYADYNTYYLNSDTIFFIDTETHKDISILEEYGFDQNSTFNYLSDSEIEEISNPDILNSNDYKEIKLYYDNFNIKYRNRRAVESILSSLEQIMSKEENTNLLSNTTISAKYEELKTSINNLSINIDTLTSNEVSSCYENYYAFIKTIVDEFYKENLANIDEINILELVQNLDETSNEFKAIYSYYVTDDTIDLATVKDTLNSIIDKYNNNLDLDITNLESIINSAKDIYNNSITTENTYENVLNKQRIINISNVVNSIIDAKISDCVEEEKTKIKVEYDKDIVTPTNEDITATVIIGEHTTITNNAGSNKYTFKQNGTFTFELDIKGTKVSVQVTIANINKDYNIEKGYISNIAKNTKILDFKDNLGIKQFTITRDGKTININEDVVATGDVLKFDNKEYTLIVCGDINSDGDCGIHDLISYRKYLLDYTQYDNIREMAADVNQDSILDLKDLVGIRNILLD